MIKNPVIQSEDDPERDISRRSSNYLWEAGKLGLEQQQISSSHPSTQSISNLNTAANPYMGIPAQIENPPRQNFYRSPYYSAQNFDQMALQNLSISPPMYYYPAYCPGYPLPTVVGSGIPFPYGPPPISPSIYREPRRILSWNPPDSSETTSPRPNLSSPEVRGGSYSNEKYVESIIKPYEESNGDLKLLEGKVAILAHFQSGSRYLQKMLTKSSSQLISFFINEVRIYI